MKILIVAVFLVMADAWWVYNSGPRTPMVCQGPFDGGVGFGTVYADGGSCTTRYMAWTCSPENYALANNPVPTIAVSMPVDGGCSQEDK